MRKLFTLILIALFSNLLVSSASHASTKSGGQNQSGGCKTKDYPYSYTDKKNKLVHGDLKVGVCVNEHYSTALRNWVGQTDVYMTETGAYAYCSVDLELDGIDPTNPYNLNYYNYSNSPAQSFPGIHCPNRTNYTTHNKGLTFERKYKPHSGIGFTNNNIGVRFYGNAKVYVKTGVVGRYLISDTNDGTFITPSLTMR